MEQNAAKRMPYGVSDFVDVIVRNQYYVDKTMYLSQLEDEADSLFFVRPHDQCEPRNAWRLDQRFQHRLAHLHEEELQPDTVRKVFNEKPGEFDPRKYCGPARDLMEQMYKHKITDVLGSDNKLANLD